MKYTIVLIGLLTISSTLAVKERRNEDLKGKRQTVEGYGSGLSSQTYQLQSPGEGNSVNIGAGYSVGGSRPSFAYSGHSASPSYHISSDVSQGGNPHQTVQLAPLTLQSPQGSLYGTDLSQLMSQLSQGLSSGALSLEPAAGGGYKLAGQDASLPQYTFGTPKQQYSEPTNAASVPQYATGTKGLSSYGATGPVLFNPSDSQPQNVPQTLSYSAPPSLEGHSFPAFTHGSSHGLSLSGAGHSLGGSSHGGSGHPLSYTIGSLSHPSYGALIKGFSSGHSNSGKIHSFRPSAYVGSSLGDLSNGFSFAAAPTIGHYPGSSGGLNFGSSGGLNFGSLSGYGGSSKHSYQPVKSEAPLPSLSPLSSSGQSHSGLPTSSLHSSQSSSYNPSQTAHTASSSPQYYVTSSKSSASAGFNEGSSFKSPGSSNSALGPYSPKYSFGGYSGSSARFAPKDAQGSYSDTVYNTIKYSEELKPRTYMH